MSEKKMERIYLAVQNIRTLTARTRPYCTDTRDCPRCPAKITLSNRIGIACLFDICHREREHMKESVRKIICCVCRRPMILTASGSGDEKHWRCNTPGCVIHDYARRKNRYLLQ
jgi:hypothetical protein